jgi:hypothetical protein
VEAVTVPAAAFLSQAGKLFAEYPIVRVGFEDLWLVWTMEDGSVSVAQLTDGEPRGSEWPAQLFPEFAAGVTVRYASRRVALADLSNRAAGYGRRKAGIRIEPPALLGSRRSSMAAAA